MSDWAENIVDEHHKSDPVEIERGRSKVAIMCDWLGNKADSTFYKKRTQNEN
jgi:hypothetical protein